MPELESREGAVPCHEAALELTLDLFDYLFPLHSKRRAILINSSLILIIVLYLAFGSTVFYMTEAETQHQQQLDKEHEIRLCVERIVNTTLSNMSSGGNDVISNNKNVAAALAADNVMQQCFVGCVRPRDWNLVNSFVFAFSAVTTLGYGHLSVTTRTGHVFYLIFGMFGIPLMMLMIANVGQFTREGILLLKSRGERIWRKVRTRFRKNASDLARRISTASFGSAGLLSAAGPAPGSQHHNSTGASVATAASARDRDVEKADGAHDNSAAVLGSVHELTQNLSECDKPPSTLHSQSQAAPGAAGTNRANSDANNNADEEDEEQEAEMTSTTFLLVFLFYIAFGAFVRMIAYGRGDFIQGFYMNFVALTSDLGNVVADKIAWLPFSLSYIVIGVALCTIAIEIGSQHLRKLHYLGKRIKRAGKVKIWIGGQCTTVEDFLRTAAVHCDIPAEKLARIDLGDIVESAAVATAAKHDGHAVPVVVPKKSRAPQPEMEPLLDTRMPLNNTAYDLPMIDIQYEEPLLAEIKPVTAVGPSLVDHFVPFEPLHLRVARQVAYPTSKLGHCQPLAAKDTWVPLPAFRATPPALCDKAQEAQKYVCMPRPVRSRIKVIRYTYVEADNETVIVGPLCAAALDAEIPLDVVQVNTAASSFVQTAEPLQARNMDEFLDPLEQLAFDQKHKYWAAQKGDPVSLYHIYEKEWAKINRLAQPKSSNASAGPLGVATASTSGFSPSPAGTPMHRARSSDSNAGSDNSGSAIPVLSRRAAIVSTATTAQPSTSAGGGGGASHAPMPPAPRALKGSVTAPSARPLKRTATSGLLKAAAMAAGTGAAVQQQHHKDDGAGAGVVRRRAPRGTSREAGLHPTAASRAQRGPPPTAAASSSSAAPPPASHKSKTRRGDRLTQTRNSSAGSSVDKSS